MYNILQEKEQLVLGFDFLKKSDLIPHEETVVDRALSLLNYLRSIEGYVVIPSILVCSNTKIIIDGHHRFWALNQLGVKTFPVTLIDYSSQLIVPHINSSITKKDILDSGLSQNLLSPKSSFHHFTGVNDKRYFPLILLSELSLVDF